MKPRHLEDYRANECTICTGKYPLGWTAFKQQEGKTVLDVETFIVVICDKHSESFHDAMGKLIKP